MIRFLVLSFALLLLLMGVFAFTFDTLGLTPSGSQADFGFGRGQLPVRTVLGIWSLEALGLIVLFMMVEGRWPTWWQDGLAVGWIAWVFRGPLLVLTVAGATRLSPDPWWEMALRWFLLYSLLGLVVARVGKGIGRGEKEEEKAEAEPSGEVMESAPGWTEQEVLPGPMASDAEQPEAEQPEAEQPDTEQPDAEQATGVGEPLSESLPEGSAEEPPHSPEEALDADRAPEPEKATERTDSPPEFPAAEGGR